MNIKMGLAENAAWQKYTVTRDVMVDAEAFNAGFISCHDLLMPLLIEAMPHVTSADTLLDGYRWSKVADSLLVERLREVILDTCRKCGGEMRAGVAMGQTVTGMPDLIGSDEVCTVSPGGSGKIISCMKCVDCGWSVTK